MSANDPRDNTSADGPRFALVRRDDLREVLEWAGARSLEMLGSEKLAESERVLEALGRLKVALLPARRPGDPDDLRAGWVEWGEEAQLHDE
jgi:hypothetical protein